MKRLCMVLMLFSSITVAFADSLDINYFSAENIRKFAGILYQEEDYLRAAGEYQRFLALSNSAGDSALYKIAVCYEKADQRNRSIYFYHRIYREFPHSPLVDYANYQISLNLHLLKRYREANEFIETSLLTPKKPLLENDLLYLAGINLIYQNDWQGAIAHFEKAAETASEPEIKNLFQKGKQLAEGRFVIPRKSSTTAGLLSAILPGSGKMYAGQVGDGIYSFIMIGLSGYLAWDGFNDEGLNSVKGWIFGTVTGILYFGNIYGSAAAARRYNSQKLQQYIDGMNPQISFYSEINF